MQMTEHPVTADVSIVIPTLGREVLFTCLDSIATGTTWPAELIVVDQGANPQVEEWVGELCGRGLNAVHLRCSESGIAVATNMGLARIRTPYAAVTHDDCRVDARWLELASSRVRTGGLRILTGRVEPEGDGVVVTVKTSRENATYTKPLIDGDVLFPMNMVFSAGVFDLVGRFDEHSSLRLAGEDNDWAHRALRAGVSIHYDPEIVVYHLARQSRHELAGIYETYARGQGSFYGKHLMEGDAFIALRATRDLLRAPWLLLRGAIQRNSDLTAMGAGELKGLLPGIWSGLRRAGR
jgi:glycosyltransferase involved in cell wall biosynthesis